MQVENFDPGMDDAAKKKLLAVVNMSIAMDKENAYSNEIDLTSIIGEGQAYYDCNQPLPENNYGQFRDTRNYRNIETLTPLFAISEPRYTFQGASFNDDYMADVFKDIDDRYWLDLGMRHKVAMATKDMLKFGTGVMSDDIVKRNGRFELECNVRSIAEFLVGDWTEYEVDKQPRITEICFVPINECREQYPEIADLLEPGSLTGDILNPLKEMWQNIIKVSGSKGIQFEIVDEEKVKKQWHSGNCIVLKHWYRENGLYKRVIIANNNLASAKTMPNKSYPHYFFRYQPQAKHFLGTPMYKVDRHYSDAKTEAMHAILYHAAAFGRGFWLIPDNADNDPSELQSLFNVPGSVIMYPPQLRGQIDLKLPSPLPQAQAQILQITDQEADLTSGNLPWVSGAVNPGSDPAQKSALFQQAGMNRLKMQAQFIDDEMLRMGRNRLWFYQKFIPSSEIIKSVGDSNPNGTPRFINVNYVIQMETYRMLEQLVREGKGYQFDMTMLRPKELAAQVKRISQELMPQLEQQAEEEGAVLDIRLNDLSLGEYTVVTKSAETLQYNELKKAQYMIPLAELGLLHAWEIRKQGGYSISKSAMKGLKANTPMTPIEQYAQALKENAANPEGLQQVLAAMLKEIQTLQEAFKMA